MKKTHATQSLTMAALSVAVLLAASTTAMAFQPGGGGGATKVAQAAESTEPAAVLSVEEQMALGETLFAANCAGCHGATGEGPARPLAGNPNLKHVVLIASQVIFGGEFMPKFPMNDTEIAAIGTYIRSSWGNDLGPITAEQVGMFR